MRKHPYVCDDTPKRTQVSRTTPSGSGGSLPPAWSFSTQDIARPKPPGAVEGMERMAGKHLVEVLLRHKPGEADANAQRRYNELYCFYVAANRYEHDTAIGTHTDYNALYVVHPQQQVVISCSMVADGALRISPHIECHQFRGARQQIH